MKWDEIKNLTNDTIQSMQERSGDSLARCYTAGWLRLMLEVHGDLDQLAALTRERRDLQKQYNGIAAAILEQWLIHTTINKRAAERAEEAHAQVVELHALLIAREKRASAAEEENKRRWDELVKADMLARKLVSTDEPTN